MSYGTLFCDTRASNTRLYHGIEDPTQQPTRRDIAQFTLNTRMLFRNTLPTAKQAVIVRVPPGREGMVHSQYVRELWARFRSYRLNGRIIDPLELEPLFSAEGKGFVHFDCGEDGFMRALEFLGDPMGRTLVGVINERGVVPM